MSEDNQVFVVVDGTADGVVIKAADIAAAEAAEDSKE